MALLTTAGTTSCSPPSGARPAADPRLLDGVIFGQLGAAAEPKRHYDGMTRTAAFHAPIAWATSPPTEFDALSSPGATRRGCASTSATPPLQRRVAEFWALDRPVGAICHGVLVLARTTDPATGRSVLAGARTTCLPKYMERSAYFATAWKLGRYYRTYPAYVEDEVRAALDEPATQFARGPRTLPARHRDRRRGTFVVEDGNYVSARWPGDAYAFARALLRRIEQP